jgi:hypothetical protein
MAGFKLSNRTPQDRLYHRLRIANIKNIDEANEFLDKTFLNKWQKHFTVERRNPFEAHTPTDGLDLKCILCIKETRRPVKLQMISKFPCTARSTKSNPSALKLD